ncbi:MAG: hypothetical protein ABI528_08380 [bacterium]
MHKSTLIQILSSFSEKDFKKFGKFISSSYFNTNSKLIELYSILKNYYPEFNSPEIRNEYFFTIMYGNKKYVAGTMKYLLSEMESLAETFIGIEKKDEIMTDLCILKEFNDKELNNLFEKQFKIVKKKLLSCNSERELYDLLLSNIYASYADRKREKQKKRKFVNKSGSEPVDNLVKFFLKSMLDNISALSNYKSVVDEKTEIPLVNEIAKFIEKEKKYREDEGLNLYLLQIKMLLNEDKNSFLQLKEVVNRKSKKHSGDQITGIITNLQAYCTLRLLKGDDIRNEEFEIAKLRMKYDLMLHENKITIDIFYKTFMLAISVNEFEWAKGFLNKYSKNLEEKFQNNAIQYCTARLYYQDKEFEKALRELSKIENYSFIHYKPAVKILQMMIYYDMKFISEASDSVNSFIQFLRNDSLITSGIKKAYENFIKIYSKLLRIEFTDKVSKINDIKFQIDNHKELLIGRNWFMTRLDELENKLTKRKLKVYKVESL